MKTIYIKQAVEIEKVADILCSALEGGSNYWYSIDEKIEPIGWSFFGHQSENTTDVNTKYAHLYPFNPGGALLIDDSHADEPELKKPVMLNGDRIVKGLETWAADEDFNRAHWSNFLSDNWDGETADVFLQYCIFGKVIYG